MSDNTIEVTDANFEELVNKSAIPVVVDFWAPWCGPCRAIAPVLEAIAAEYKGKVTVAKMNVDENEKIPETFGVRGIPFVVVIKEGKMVASTVGAGGKSKFTDLIDKALK